MNISFCYLAHICKNGSMDVDIAVTNHGATPLGAMPLTAELYVSAYPDGPWVLAAQENAAAAAPTLRNLLPGESCNIRLTFKLAQATPTTYIMINFLSVPPAPPA